MSNQKITDLSRFLVLMPMGIGDAVIVGLSIKERRQQ